MLLESVFETSQSQPTFGQLQDHLGKLQFHPDCHKSMANFVGEYFQARHTLSWPMVTDSTAVQFHHVQEYICSKPAYMCV